MFVGCTPAILRPGLLAAAGLRPQDVFATTLDTGTDAAKTITTGFPVDMVWRKSRNPASSHYLYDKFRGRGGVLFSDSPSTEVTGSPAGTDLASFTATGFTLGTEFNANVNTSGRTYVSWSFRQADKFCKIGIFTHVNGVASTIDLSSLGIVGDAIIKRRDADGDWYVYHRSLTAGYNLRLNTPAAQSVTDAFISVSGTTLTFAAGAPSGSYSIQARAHDPDTVNGIVQCGSGTVGVPVALPWPTQWVLVKSTDQASQWVIVDTIRGFGSGNDALLYANLPNAEASADWFDKSGNTFTNTTGLGDNFVWVAIRAPIL